jgi:hypothetical protein
MSTERAALSAPIIGISNARSPRRAVSKLSAPDFARLTRRQAEPETNTATATTNQNFLLSSQESFIFNQWEVMISSFSSKPSIKHDTALRLVTLTSVFPRVA